MKGIALLDVNVLVALFNPDHIHHETAHDWFADHRRRGWATCALTELGLTRILANPHFWNHGERTAAIVERVRAFGRSGDHHFWKQDLSLSDATRFNLAYAGGHRQLTDIYLLGLAVVNKGYLATFDRRIPLAAVRDAKRSHLAVIAPAESPG